MLVSCIRDTCFAAGNQSLLRDKQIESTNNGGAASARRRKRCRAVTFI